MKKFGDYAWPSNFDICRELIFQTTKPMVIIISVKHLYKSDNLNCEIHGFYHPWVPQVGPNMRNKKLISNSSLLMLGYDVLELLYLNCKIHAPRVKSSGHNGGGGYIWSHSVNAYNVKNLFYSRTSVRKNYLC